LFKPIESIYVQFTRYELETIEEALRFYSQHKWKLSFLAEKAKTNAAAVASEKSISLADSIKTLRGEYYDAPNDQHGSFARLDQRIQQDTIQHEAHTIGE
jgi:hypothetical protein